MCYSCLIIFFYYSYWDTPMGRLKLEKMFIMEMEELVDTEVKQYIYIYT